MRINFFEEYPTEENMAKLEWVDWPATVLVAAQSLQEFEAIREKYSRSYPNITFGWWPTVPESYWVSGFSTPLNLDRLFAEITSKKQERELPILIDLELPLDRYLWVKNFFNIRGNKKRIQRFLADAKKLNLKIYTAEYPAPNRFFLWLWQFIGMSPSFAQPHTRLPMVYSSMGMKSLGEGIWTSVKNFEKQFAVAHQGCVGFGLGTIATGVRGNEPILSPEALARDLTWAEISGVEEVFIFRLGGFTYDYKAVVNL